jgi:hypothetical protein
MSQQVLPHEVTPMVAEEIHRQVARYGKRNDLATAERGLRIARDRHPLMMLALEKIAEQLDALGEAQYGETRRSASATFAEKREVTVVQMWKEAYRLADEGIPDQQFGHYYAAAASFAGI